MTTVKEFIAHVDAQSQQRAAGAVPAQEIDTKAASDRILDSAEVVLRRYGYAGFTTRRVAQEANMSLGNLTYHFPTKSVLVRALINRLMSSYLGRFEDSLQMPEGGVGALVQWLLKESVDHEAMWLFRELWAMALHDEVVRESIDDFYDELMARITIALVTAYPGSDPQAISDLVHLIAAISEGSSVIYGTRRSRASSHQRIVDLVGRIVAMVAPTLCTSEHLPRRDPKS